MKVPSGRKHLMKTFLKPKSKLPAESKLPGQPKLPETICSNAKKPKSSEIKPL